MSNSNSWLMTEFEATCPYCGQVQQMHASPDGTSPNPGDISICWRCAEIALYTDTLGLEKVPADQLDRIMSNWQLQEMLLIMRSTKQATVADNN